MLRTAGPAPAQSDASTAGATGRSGHVARSREKGLVEPRTELPEVDQVDDPVAVGVKECEVCGAAGVGVKSRADGAQVEQVDRAVPRGVAEQPVEREMMVAARAPVGVAVQGLA